MQEASTGAATATESTAAEAPRPKSAFQGFVGQNQQVEEKKNPHAYRYAYMPGVWLAKSDPLKTGYSFYPQGALLGFKTFQRGGMYDYIAGINGDEAVANKIVEISAEFAQYHALIENQVIESFDNGFRSFDKLTGDPLAEHYFDALHPSFELLDHQCPRSLEVCPTCRKDLLPASDKDFKDFLSIYGQRTGLQLNFDLDVAKSVRDTIIESCNGFITTAGDLWRELSDQKERTRNSGQPCVLQPSHYHYRNVLHVLDAMEFEEQKELRLAAMIANQTKGTQATPDEVALLREQNAVLMKRLDAIEAQQSKKNSTKEKTKEDGE